MKKGKLISNVSLLFILILFVFSGCENQNILNGGVGTLKGKISIGPLCPVERIPPDPACQPTAETYKAYPISIWTADMKTKITDIKPSPDGNYSARVPYGTYNIVLEKQLAGVGGSNLPATVDIKEDSATVLDISIDTGIR
jgi:hypothetical protein